MPIKHRKYLVINSAFKLAESFICIFTLGSINPSWSERHFAREVVKDLKQRIAETKK